MKRLKAILMFLMVLILVSGLTLIGYAQPKSSIKMGGLSAWPVSHVSNDVYKEFIKRVNDRSKGEIEIKFIGGPEVSSIYDQFKVLMAGGIDMINTSAAYSAGIVPEFEIFALAKPGLIIEALRKSGLYPIVNRILRQRTDSILLGCCVSGQAFYVMSTKPLNSVSDIKGLKLRGGGGLSDLVLQALGASTVKIATNEVYEGLQRKIIDGAIRNTLSFMNFKEYEVMKYILSPAFMDFPAYILMSGKAWDKLSAAQQKVIFDTIIKLEPYALKYYQETEKKNLDELLTKQSCKVTKLSSTEAAQLDEARTGGMVRSYILKTCPVEGPELLRLIEPYTK